MATTNNPLPALFLFEASVNIIGGIPFIFYPSAVLHLMTHPDPTFPLTTTSTPSTASIQFVQYLGVIFWGLAVPLILAVQDTPHRKASRRMVYEMLGSVELLMVPLMLWQLNNTTGSVGGMTGTSLVLACAVMGGALSGRIYALTFKKDWFGEDSIDGKKTM